MNVHVTRGLVETGPALPVFVRWRFKWLAGLLVCAASLVIYGLANRYPLREPSLLPMTALDEAVPLLPWTVWVYWSGALFLLVVYASNRCVVSMNKHLYSFLALVLFSAAVFAVFPTTYPRASFPTPAGLDGATGWVFRTLRDSDTPGCCAPSLHVSLAFLIAFGFLEDRLYHPWPFLAAFAWACAMTASTLTTKQHYAFDVVTGLGAATFFFLLFHRWLPYRLTGAVKRDCRSRQSL
jgi:hypothetical protein